jgi:hypothetical protein
MTVNTYILAPALPENMAVLEVAVAEYPAIVQERRVKYVYAKSVGDIVDGEGALLVPFNTNMYVYLCANTAEIDNALLSQVTDAQTFTIDTQPFGQFWI